MRMSRKQTMRVRPDMEYEEIPSLLTTAEAGVVAGKSQSAIQEMIRRGKLEFACHDLRR